MTREAEHAAQALVQFVGLPSHLVSVWIHDEGQGVKLLVNLDPSVFYRAKEIPSEFMGFEVHVMKKQTFLSA